MKEQLYASNYYSGNYNSIASSYKSKGSMYEKNYFKCWQMDY